MISVTTLLRVRIDDMFELSTKELENVVKEMKKVRRIARRYHHPAAALYARLRKNQATRELACRRRRFT